MEMTVRGLKEIIKRMRKFPSEYRRQTNRIMTAALLVLQQNVPDYPDKPSGSTYNRTGTLGRTLGVGMSGQPVGKPDIYQVRRRGGYVEARFGTRLGYAPPVIGDETQAERMKHWWQMKDISERARSKLTDLFDTFGKVLARFLEGKR